MLVVDASVLVAAMADDGPSGAAVRARPRNETLAVPEVAGLEVASVLRRQNRAGLLDDRRAQLALVDLAALPLHRASHVALLARSWQLRDNLTMYDAAYVALAEALDCLLLTATNGWPTRPGQPVRSRFSRRPDLTPARRPGPVTITFEMSDGGAAV